LAKYLPIKKKRTRSKIGVIEEHHDEDCSVCDHNRQKDSILNNLDEDQERTDFKSYRKEAIYENMYIKTDEIEADVKALAHLAKIAGKPNLKKELKPFKSK